MITAFFLQSDIKRKACLTVGFLFIFCSYLFSQNTKHLDSLLTLYHSGDYKKSDQLSILKEISDNCNDPEKIFYYSNILISEARKLDSTGYEYIGITQRGSAFQLKGDYSKALQCYFEAEKLVKPGIQTGALNMIIADVYSLMGNHDNSVKYYRNAVPILKEENDSLRLAMLLYNLGDEFLKSDILDSALFYTQQSQLISQKINYQIGEAFGYGNLGVIYLKQGNTPLAEFNLNQSISRLEPLNEYAAICEFLISMSEVNLHNGRIDDAKKYAEKSLDLAHQYGLKKEIGDANLTLSGLYEKSGNLKKSLSHYKAFIIYRDSVNNLQTIQKVADLQTDFEVSKKQKEVDLLATKNKLRIAERNGFIFASLLLTVILMISINFYNQRAKRNKLIATQKMQEAEIIHQKNLMETVITSQEAERKRIGMDLHDEVGAALSTLRIKMEQHFGQESHNIDADSYKNDIDKIIANMRNISHALSPRISGSFGFYDAIHELADGVNQSGIIHMDIDFNESHLPDFPDEQKPMALYRVIAELINNTLKHAKAGHIRLKVEIENEILNIDYSDDGIGFSHHSKKSSGGIGMQNIESRLDMIKAKWKIEAPVIGGYRVLISVPIK
ncbi:MAG: hypothetical protein JNJ58_05945 [Chitinophagaceae bacterium]|nr:hypothetical protein [Chitinophagaceae bacterium]